MKSPYFIFWFSFFAFVAIQFCVPSLSSQPEMWAEATTNYFWNARHLNLWDNLWAVDSGYLPWLPRLIAVLVDRLAIPTTYVAAVYQGSAVFFIAIFSSTFCLPVFRKIISSDTMRLFISLGLMIRHEYALHTFINFSYYGTVPFFLTLAIFPHLPKVKIQIQLLVGLLLFILGASKALFLSFLPAVTLLLILSFFIRTWRTNFLILGLAWAGLMIQLNTMFPLSSFFRYLPKPGNTNIAEPVLIHWGTIILNTLSGRFIYFEKHSLWTWFSVIIGSLSVLYLIYKVIKNRRDFRFNLNLLLLTFTISGAAVVMTVVAYPQLFAKDYPHFFPEPVSLFGTRWWIVPVITMYLGLMVILFKNPHRSKIISTSLFVLTLFSSEFWLPREIPQKLPWPIVGYSNWNAFAKFIPDDRNLPYCLTGDPYPLISGKDCEYLLPYPSDPTTDLNPNAQTADYYIVPKSVLKRKLIAIGIPSKFINKFAPEAELIAEDQDHKILSKAEKSEQVRANIQFFIFVIPQENIAYLRFQKPGEINTDSNPLKELPTPDWIWLGVKKD